MFFAAWLSHVPLQRFDAFWALVAACLAPGGQVFVLDELPAVAALGWEADVRTVGWRFFVATVRRAAWAGLRRDQTIATGTP